MPFTMFDTHLETLRRALAAVESRVYWSPYPDDPSTLAQDALEEGKQAFHGCREASFYLDQPGLIDRVGFETSPFGLPLDIQYPRCSADALIQDAQSGISAWTKAGPDTRCGVCLEALHRLSLQAVELAHAVSHTTGQAFSVAFRDSVAHALDRGLEAVATSYRAMKQVSSSAVWSRPGEASAPEVFEKTFVVVPRGVALVLANAVAPTWTTYPALFSSLATGNPVIIKPHPHAVLPLALTVATLRQVLKEAGFDPGLVSLLVDRPDEPVAGLLATNPEIRIIDYAGTRAFAGWLERNALQAALFLQTGGVNCVVVDSTDDYSGLLRNLALSLSLGGGHRANMPRLVLYPREGVAIPDGRVDGPQFVRDLVTAVGQLAALPERAAGILGTHSLVEGEEALGGMLDDVEVLREMSFIAHPHWPGARMCTPLLVATSHLDRILPTLCETALPVAALSDVATVSEALAMAGRVMRQWGGFTLSLHSTKDHVQEMAQDIAFRTGTLLAINETGDLPTSASAAYSDLQGSGINPASNCAMIDGAYIHRRFYIAETRHRQGPLPS